MKRLPLKLFSNLHAAIALSTHAQNIFYSVELDYIWFAGGYGALYACTKRFLTVWMARWDLITFDLWAATALSTHAQNASYKLNCRNSLGRKSAPQARKNEVQELKQPFLDWKMPINSSQKQ